MERLEFGYDYGLVNEIETLLEGNDDYTLISVYGKYDIIKTLLEDLIAEDFCIANEIELEDYAISNYDKEFVLYVKEDGVNVEKAYHYDEYLYSGGNISFVHEDCSSALLKYIESDKVYEFGYNDEENGDYDNEESDQEHEYMVNGKPVSVKEYNDFVSKFAPDKVIESDNKSGNGDYSISVKYNLDANEVLKIIDDMERRMAHINDMFHEMDNFRRLFN